MSDVDLFDDPEDRVEKPMTTEQAYAGAGPIEWNGIELEGWTGRRRAATFEIGFTGAGSVLDPIRVLYCCAIPPKEVDAVFRSPSLATERFLQWAEKHQLLEPSQDGWEEAFNIANTILEQVEKSMAERSDPGPAGTDMGNATGQQN